MKLNVPFYKQTTNLNCGPTALKMALLYFGKNYSIKLLEKKTEIKKGKGIFTIQIAAAASKLGYKTIFFSKSVKPNPDNFKMEFYKKYSEDIKRINEAVKKAKLLGVEIHEKKISLGKLLEYVTKESIPIVLLDWNIIKKEKDYQGHFVPVVGYDSKDIYIHNHGLNDPQKFMKIPRKTFDKARKAKGTDEDIAIIFKNPKQKSL